MASLLSYDCRIVGEEEEREEFCPSYPHTVKPPKKRHIGDGPLSPLGRLSSVGGCHSYWLFVLRCCICIPPTDLRAYKKYVSPIALQSAGQGQVVVAYCWRPALSLQSKH